MKIKIIRNFHVFVPGEGRDKKVAFGAGSVLGPGDMPDGHTMQDWIDKGLAVATGTAGVADEAEAGAAV